MTQDRVFGFMVLLALGLLEFAGRYARDDFIDGLLMVIYLIVIGVVALRHQNDPLSWVETVADRVRRLGHYLARHWVHLDVDLRGRPPLRRSPPRMHVVVCLLCVATAAVVAVLRREFPHLLREGLGDVFYLGYLTILVVIWAVLLLGGLAMALLPLAIIHLGFAGLRFRPEPNRLQWERGVQAAYLILLLVVAFLVPAWIGLAIVLGSWALSQGMMLVPGRPKLDFVWKPMDGAESRVVDWSWLLSVQCTLFAGLTTTFALLAGGDALWGMKAHHYIQMPVTIFFAHAFTWTAAAASLATTAILSKVLVQGYRSDPASPARPSVYVEVAEEDARRRVKQTTQEFGWTARFPPASAEPVDVRIVLDERQKLSERDPFVEPTWPLRVSLDDLTDHDTQRRILRRREVQLRRMFFSGLERLFKAASGFEFDSGDGFWLAPHYWFVPGLTRDDDDDESTEGPEMIGPPYRAVMHRECRSYIRSVLDALDIDLIFVEDGVGYRRLRRVLRSMFEVYDIFGGSRPLEDRQLTGIHGVRTMIHDHSDQNPFESSDYPEPDYHGIGRARILHVFRDRGGEEEPVDVPIDSSHEPVLLGV